MAGINYQASPEHLLIVIGVLCSHIVYTLYNSGSLEGCPIPVSSLADFYIDIRLTMTVVVSVSD